MHRRMPLESLDGAAPLVSVERIPMDKSAAMPVTAFNIATRLIGGRRICASRERTLRRLSFTFSVGVYSRGAEEDAQLPSKNRTKNPSFHSLFSSLPSFVPRHVLDCRHCECVRSRTFGRKETRSDGKQLRENYFESAWREFREQSLHYARRESRGAAHVSGQMALMGETRWPVRSPRWRACPCHEQIFGPIEPALHDVLVQRRCPLIRRKSVLK